MDETARAGFFIFFKSEEKLSAKEKKTMQEVLRTQSEISFLRGFLHKVWAIFEVPTTAAEAQAKLAELKRYAAHHEKDGYTKSIAFLEENFKNMTMFLRAPGVQRNSLAKPGMRVLRRSAKSDRLYRLDKRRLRA